MTATFERPPPNQRPTLSPGRGRQYCNLALADPAGCQVSPRTLTLATPSSQLHVHRQHCQGRPELAAVHTECSGPGLRRGHGGLPRPAHAHSQPPLQPLKKRALLQPQRHNTHNRAKPRQRQSLEWHNCTITESELLRSGHAQLGKRRFSHQSTKQVEESNRNRKLVAVQKVRSCAMVNTKRTPLGVCKHL